MSEELVQAFPGVNAARLIALALENKDLILRILNWVDQNKEEVTKLLQYANNLIPILLKVYFAVKAS